MRVCARATRLYDRCINSRFVDTARANLNRSTGRALLQLTRKHEIARILSTLRQRHPFERVKAGRALRRKPESTATQLT